MATSPGRERPAERGDTFDGDRGTTARSQRHRRASTETKQATKTTEFYVYIVATVGVLLAGLLTKAGDGHDDRLAADQTWLIVGILTVGYLISRGLAKSGSREPYYADADNR
jgi:hypothetical protein